MNISISSDPQTIAENCADVIWAEDKTSRMLGITRDSVGPGTAAVSMIVGDEMVNELGCSRWQMSLSRWLAIPATQSQSEISAAFSFCAPRLAATG